MWEIVIKNKYKQKNPLCSCQYGSNQMFFYYPFFLAKRHTWKSASTLQTRFDAAGVKLGGESAG